MVDRKTITETNGVGGTVIGVKRNDAGIIQLAIGGDNESSTPIGHLYTTGCMVHMPSGGIIHADHAKTLIGRTIQSTGGWNDIIRFVTFNLTAHDYGIASSWCVYNKDGTKGQWKWTRA